MSVVTTDELASYLGGWQFNPVQKLDAEAILDGVQSELEMYLNRPIQQRRLLELVTPDITGVAYLKVTPVVALHGIYRVKADGSCGDLVEASGIFRMGQNFIRMGSWSSAFIDYTGGVNGDVAPGVKLAMKRVAAREFTAKHSSNVVLENTEGRPAEDTPPEPKGWTEEELARFKRWKRRVIA